MYFVNEIQDLELLIRFFVIKKIDGRRTGMVFGVDYSSFDRISWGVL